MTETKSDPAPPILDLHQVCMRFGGITALKELSYGVPPGIVQAVSGCDANGYCTSITVRTPAIPNSAFGNGEPCDDNGDGHAGQKWVPVSASVLVRSLETGCDTKPLSNAFLFTPTDGSCRNDTAPGP